MKFRKKPVIIDAIKWTGENTSAIAAFFRAFSADDIVQYTDAADPIGTATGFLVIPTPEGEMTASPGDWIIRGVAGEFYPCKPHNFLATYEPVA